MPPVSSSPTGCAVCGDCNPIARDQQHVSLQQGSGQFAIEAFVPKLAVETLDGSVRLSTTVDGNMQLGKGGTTAKIKKRIAHLEDLGELTAEAAEYLKIHKQVLRHIESNGSVRYRFPMVSVHDLRGPVQ